MVVVLLTVLLRPTYAHGWPFGVGPDFPVYLWWTRVGAAGGISLVGVRPGTPALLAVLRGSTHLPLVAVVAGTQYALVPSIGMAAIALVRRGMASRWKWSLAGSLAGLYAVHLAGGYLSNLIFATAFVGAAAALATRSRRATTAAALLLGGGGLAHPQFFALGAGIMVGAAFWSFVQRRETGPGSDLRRVAAALAAGALVVAAGLLLSMTGAPALSVDTSKDAFLRHAGMKDLLVKTYRDRFHQKAHLYAPLPVLSLAYPGYLRTSGFARGFLFSWAAISVVGVPLGLATGLFPPERILTFGFAFPILAALGVVWIHERLGRRRMLALVAAAALISWMAYIWIGSWAKEQTFMSAREVTDLNVSAQIASTLPEGTHLVYVVNDIDLTAIFLATHAENVIRATLPLDRVADAYVYVGDSANLRLDRPTVRGHIQYDTLSRALLSQIPPGPRAIFVVKDLNRVPEALSDPTLFRWTPGVTSSVPGPRDLAPLADELTPSSPAQITLASAGILALLLLAGLGWSLWAFGPSLEAVALAPALGAAMLAITGLATERSGIPITGSAGPTLILVATAAAGFAFRRCGRRTPSAASDRTSA